jgi:hypothetical protein
MAGHTRKGRRCKDASSLWGTGGHCCHATVYRQVRLSWFELYLFRVHSGGGGGTRRALEQGVQGLEKLSAAFSLHPETALLTFWGHCSSTGVSMML